MSTWKSFHFNSNRAWGLMDSEEKWEEVITLHEEDAIDLGEARMSNSRGKDKLPFFGFGGYPGCTLRKWFNKNGMDLGV